MNKTTALFLAAILAAPVGLWASAGDAGSTVTPATTSAKKHHGHHHHKKGAKAKSTVPATK